MAKKTELVPQDEVTLQGSVMEIRTEMDTVQAACSALEIVDDESQAKAGEIRGRIKAIQKQLKTQLDFFVGPAKAYVKAVTDQFKLLGTGLETADSTLSRGMIAYHEAKEAAARKEREKIEKAQAKAIEKGKTPPPMVMPEPEQAVRHSEGQTVFTKVWTFEITGEVSVPREYCAPDSAKIRAAVAGGVRDIPGVRIFEETRTQRR